MGGEDLGLHQPGAASTARSGGREDHQQAGLAAVGVEPGLQVPDPVQVGHGHPGRGRHRSEDIQRAGHQQKHQQADGQEPECAPPAPPAPPWRMRPVAQGRSWEGPGVLQGLAQPGLLRQPAQAVLAPIQPTAAHVLVVPFSPGFDVAAVHADGR
jgi:hypothetical protein